MKDSVDVVTYKKFVLRLRVHIFLNGFYVQYESLSEEILRKEPALDFEETYAYVHRNVAYRLTILGDAVLSEPSVMVAYGPKLHYTQHHTSGSQTRNTTSQECLCTHCGENWAQQVLLL